MALLCELTRDKVTVVPLDESVFFIQGFINTAIGSKDLVPYLQKRGSVLGNNILLAVS